MLVNNFDRYFFDDDDYYFLYLGHFTNKFFSYGFCKPPGNLLDMLFFLKLGDSDVFISSLYARNRSLPGDKVAVEIELRRFWRVSCFYRFEMKFNIVKIRIQHDLNHWNYIQIIF